MKLLPRVNLCAGEFQPVRSLIQAEPRAASDGLGQVTERIGRALLEFGLALVSFQVSRRYRMMTDRAHLSCFTISAACRGRLRHPRKHKR
jgi:hypothetical protein